MNTMFRSATFKLTMWYLAIITVISLSFSVVIYHLATGELQAGLQHQTLRIYQDFPVFNGSPLLRSDRDIDAGTHHIFWQLFYFNILVVVLAGITSYFLARLTLEPIEAAHARQARFTADVSHELRTPLTALKMTSEVALLDPKASKDELRDALSSNLEEVTKMDLLINNLLRLTRLDADTVQASFKPLQTTDIITAATEQVSQQAAGKDITISTTGKDLPVYGDRDSLIQLLVILLDNAIKYSPAKSQVEIETKPDGDHTLVIVRDHGQGMTPDVLPHVFDRFYRADASRTKTTPTEGYGLGLSIAKLISDTHNANITLTSRPTQGTTATITLPTAPQTLS